MSNLDRLPQPLAEKWDWQLRGACRGRDANLFYPSLSEGRRAARLRELAAKQLCASCPVLAECRDWALRFPEEFGVWGGLTTAERRRLGRPATAREAS